MIDNTDKIELRIELKFFLDCPEDQIEKLKDKLDDFGWWVLQEIKLDKAIKNIPGATETGYDVKVIDLREKGQTPSAKAEGLK